MTAPARPLQKRWIKAAITLLILAGLLFVLLRGVQDARTAARRSQWRNTLRQISLSLHSYHDAHDVLPIGETVSVGGRPHHSWHTRILPYIEASPLYNYIDLERPWTDPVNVPHFRYHHPWFVSPEISLNTDAEGFGLSHMAGNEALFRDNEAVSLKDIASGASQTILVGEVSQDFRAWGGPGLGRDASLPPNSGPRSFGCPSGEGAYVVMVDGSVRFIASHAGSTVPSPPLPRKNLSFHMEYRTLRPRINAQLQVDSNNRIRCAWVPLFPGSKDPEENARLVAESEPLKDDDLKFFSTYSDLEVLFVEAPITDRALPHVVKLDALEALFLGSCAITDSGLQTLTKMKKLRVLSVRSPSLTADGLATFRKALPDCEIRSPRWF